MNNMQYKSFEEFLNESVQVLKEKNLRMSTDFHGLEILYFIDSDETTSDAVKEIDRFYISDTSLDLQDYFTKSAMKEVKEQIERELD